MRLVVGDVPLLVKLSNMVRIDHVLNPFTPSSFRGLKIISGRRDLEEIGKSLLSIGTNFAVRLLELEGAELASYLSSLVTNMLNVVTALADVDLAVLDMLSIFLLDHADQLGKVEIVLILQRETPVPSYRDVKSLLRMIAKKSEPVDEEAINLYVKFNIRSILDLVERSNVLDRVRYLSNVRLFRTVDEAARYLGETS